MPRAPRGPDLKRVNWRDSAWRIIASRYPPVYLFERVSPKNAVQEALIDLEVTTNPRVREEVGDITLVPPARRVSGPGATYVMAPFTHVNPKGSRFSAGLYGVYYCARSLDTAIAETIFHFEGFARDAKDPPRSEDMRVLVGSLGAQLHDVSTVSAAQRKALLDPKSYAASRPWAATLRDAGGSGVVYPSVRHKGGECVGAFWPNVVSIPKQERHLQYHWDGARVDKYFDYKSSEWILRPPD